MFGLFKKDAYKELEKQYSKKLEEAMNAQRNGKMDVYAKLSTEAEEIGKKMDKEKLSKK
jgi:hypothetical protein